MIDMERSSRYQGYIGQGFINYVGDVQPVFANLARTMNMCLCYENPGITMVANLVGQGKGIERGMTDSITLEHHGSMMVAFHPSVEQFSKGVRNLLQFTTTRNLPVSIPYSNESNKVRAFKEC